MRTLLWICWTAAVFAQSNGQIVGAVSDKSGAVMPGVNVKVRSDQTGLELAAVSDESGRFNFPRVPVGNYKIVAAKEGFRQFQSETFRLDADQSREVAVTMDLGATTESVTVTGAVAQVDTVNATIREVVDEKRISELPLNGRNPLQLVQLVPGAVTGPASGSLSRNEGIAVNGSRGTGTNYLLDGGDNNDPQENV
ncbi:MAG: carboxypeptidase regulatory-like domain-containing protein, partial [Acidobacteria bacterium]|nr:carboxypeptidase regulatory-like domain-containing protein [Acidobacteriota bacterium]